jgi:hypothetical protein
VSPVRHELGFCIAEDGILHSHRSENLKCNIALTGWTLYWRRNGLLVGYGLGLYIPEKGIPHSYSSSNAHLYQPINQ